MAALPTRIRMHIRDHITAPTSSVGVKTAALQTTLGYPITLDPEWSMLWRTLQVFFPDQATFVPYIASVLGLWCEAFGAWLEAGEENEEALERCLDGLKERGRVELVLEISTSPIKQPTTFWKSEKSLFTISFPKAEASQKSTILSGFSTDLNSMFSSASPPLQPTAGPSSTLPYHQQQQQGDPETWSHLSFDDTPSVSAVGHASQYTPASSSMRPNFQRGRHEHEREGAPGEDFLPEQASLPRPEELLRKPPYWMIVRQESNAVVTVQASHGPSIELLDSYLKRWCRGNVHLVDRPPVLEIKLHESAFGLGLLHDTLTLEAVRGREVSAMLVLAFVEGVLGYDLIHREHSSRGGGGGVWEFRRVKGFR